MKTVQQTLQQQIDEALSSVLASQEAAGALSTVSADALQVVPCANPQFGDYQWNGALPLAKALKTNPRGLAQQVIEQLNVDEISAAPEIAGPGFVNFRLRRDFIESKLTEVAADNRVGVPLTDAPRTVVVDFSAPNVAKPMHVGHIRSTVIGDGIARLLRFAGHKVITDNHIGDWGTQFGKMIIGWKKYRDDANLSRDPIGEMERLYQLVNHLGISDPEIAEEARRETAKLQGGDEENLRIWEQLRDLSQAQFDQVYTRLNINFDVTLGESFYNSRLQSMVQELRDLGIAQESEGAVIVPFDEASGMADKPLLIQKNDGSALYGTTDLATIEYRAETWNPDEIVYVVDARQRLQLQQVFTAAALWKYKDLRLVHVEFGTIQGDDGTPIKTREGGSVKLIELLDEAERRSLELAKEKSPDLTLEDQREAARVIGVGAIKYADLSQNRITGYLFSWEKMLALQGNTAPYLLYAYVRIRSIFRRAGIEADVAREFNADFVLEHPAEQELAKYLLRFNLAIDTALSDYRLNAITDYLFELASHFNSFFENCPVLKSEEPVRSSRLALCRLTADVLQRGLNLLGIETIEQM